MAKEEEEEEEEAMRSGALRIRIREQKGRKEGVEG